MKIDNLTDVQIDQLAATWALKVERPITPYIFILKQTKAGYRDIDLLPYFLIKELIQLGYCV